MPSALIKLRAYILLIVIAAAFSSCKFTDDRIPNRISFKAVAGIHYTEIRRAFDSALAFNSSGYQLSPIWKLMFYSDEYASVYNPDKNVFLKFPVTLDHDSIFNISGAWFKAMKVTRDSLVFQVLKVEGKTVYYVKSNVYMTLYADGYIKNVLHKDVEELKKPLRRDSLFVMKRAAAADASLDGTFAAREPAVFKSNNRRVTVVKEKVEADIMNKWDNSDEYMYPEYTITMNKAYENFSYKIVAIVDKKGELHFLWSLIAISPEFEKNTIHVIKGILDGYLKTYVRVTPGSTLNIAHSSSVTLNLVGNKN